MGEGVEGCEGGGEASAVEDGREKTGENGRGHARKRQRLIKQIRLKEINTVRGSIGDTCIEYRGDLCIDFVVSG